MELLSWALRPRRRDRSDSASIRVRRRSPGTLGWEFGRQTRRGSANGMKVATHRPIGMSWASPGSVFGHTVRTSTTPAEGSVLLKLIRVWLDRGDFKFGQRAACGSDNVSVRTDERDWAPHSPTMAIAASRSAEQILFGYSIGALIGISARYPKSVDLGHC